MKLTFSSVQLLSFSRKADGGKAQFSASLTKPVIAAMEWAEMPEFVTGGKLEGEIVCAEVQLTPNDEALKRHAVQIKTQKIGKFETVRLELEGSKTGKGHRTELRLTVWYTDAKGARLLEEYIQTAGKSSLSVSYEKQAQQADLPGVEKDDDAQGSLDDEADTGCVACSNGIPLVGKTDVHTSGARCTAVSVQ